MGEVVGVCEGGCVFVDGCVCELCEDVCVGVSICIVWAYVMVVGMCVRMSWQII